MKGSEPREFRLRRVAIVLRGHKGRVCARDQSDRGSEEACVSLSGGARLGGSRQSQLQAKVC